MMKFSQFLWASSAILPVLCDSYNPDTDCLDGIRTDLGEFVFAGALGDYYGDLCSNNLSTISMWAAAKIYCSLHEIDVGEKSLDELCTEYGMVELITYEETLPLLTDEYISSLRVVEFTDIDETKNWTEPVLLSKDFFTAGKRTTHEFSRQYVLHARYGWAVYGFWGGLLVIGMINNAVSHIMASRRARIAGDVEDTSHSSSKTDSRNPLKTAHHWMRANLIIPATFGSHHQRLLWWCTIPTRMETLIVTAFWVLNLVLCCVSYEIFSPNLYYSNANQYWRYIADRTGIISYANLPLIWMFSGRNNIFLWLTGWSFASFNIFHRHIARIATIQAIIHSVGYSALEINFGYFELSWKEEYWYMGGMATIAMSLLLGMSSIVLRQKSYELFLFLHIAMSVLTIVGLFYHTKIFDGEYDGYLWPLVAIWSFDRFLRIVRVAYCNLYIRFSGRAIGTTSTATYDEVSDLIRLEVTPGSKLLRAGPGQHYYIYQPMKLKGWENHPFTLAAWENAGSVSDKALHNPNSSASSSLSKVDEKDIQVIPQEAGSSSASSASLALPETTDQQKLIFFIRPFSSWTTRLRDECLKSETAKINPRVLIEGPYGEKSPLHTYENLIFIVGGTGISGAIPYLQEYVQMKDHRRNSKTRTRDITLLWTSKQPAMVRDIVAKELRPYMHRSDIHVHLHATAQDAAESTSKSLGKEKISTKAEPQVNVVHGRPNIHKAIMDVVSEVQSAGAAGGRIAILTCGPAAMADEARKTTHAALKSGVRSIEYIEESFGW